VVFENGASRDNACQSEKKKNPAATAGLFVFQGGG
jgi:hypothetical protein